MRDNYPWPDPQTTTDKQKQKVEQAAQGVLDARAKHQTPGVTSGATSGVTSGGGGATLADLYDPLTMPADLAKAHAALDRAVDRCYRKSPFPDERRRFEHLFTLYEQLTAPLTAANGKKKAIRNKKHPTS